MPRFDRHRTTKAFEWLSHVICACCPDMIGHDPRGMKCLPSPRSVLPSVMISEPWARITEEIDPSTAKVNHCAGPRSRTRGSVGGETFLPATVCVLFTLTAGRAKEEEEGDDDDDDDDEECRPLSLPRG